MPSPTAAQVAAARNSDAHLIAMRTMGTWADQHAPGLSIDAMAALTKAIEDAFAEREAAVRVEEQERLALMLPDEIIQAVHRLWEKDHLNDAIEAVRAETWAAAIVIVREQPLYHDTHTGTRQQWMKDQIVSKLSILREAARG